MLGVIIYYVKGGGGVQLFKYCTLAKRTLRMQDCHSIKSADIMKSCKQEHYYDAINAVYGAACYALCKSRL